MGSLQRQPGESAQHHYERLKAALVDPTPAERAARERASAERARKLVRPSVTDPLGGILDDRERYWEINGVRILKDKSRAANRPRHPDRRML